MRLFQFSVFRDDSVLPLPQVWMPFDDHKITTESFCDKNPLEAYEKGEFHQVPTIIGTNKDEGLLYSKTFLQDRNFLEKWWSDDSCVAFGFLGFFAFGRDVPPHITAKVDKVRNELFKGNVPEFMDLSRAFTDSGFHIATDKLARQMAKKTPVYYYHFDHAGSFSLLDLHDNALLELTKRKLGFYSTKGLGVCHFDEIPHLFMSNFVSFLDPSNKKDQDMSELMVTLWTNFATHFDPTPVTKEWPSYNSNGVTYVRLQDSKIIPKRDQIRDERLKFWADILST